MRQYTTIPHPNSFLAEQFIRLNGAAIDPKYGVWAGLAPREHRRALRMIAQDFGAKYPRGKGTHGNFLLREFYAACHTVMAHYSASRHHKMIQRHRSENVTTLGKNATTALLAFPEDGTALQNPQNGGPKITARWMTALADQKFIDGWWAPHGTGFRADRVWLTDIGIEARKIAAMRADRTQREKVAKQFVAGPVRQTPTGFTAGIDIGDRVNVIEVTRTMSEDAVALRDKVLGLLKADAKMKGGLVK